MGRRHNEDKQRDSRRRRARVITCTCLFAQGPRSGAQDAFLSMDPHRRRQHLGRDNGWPGVCGRLCLCIRQSIGCIIKRPSIIEPRRTWQQEAGPFFRVRVDGGWDRWLRSARPDATLIKCTGTASMFKAQPAGSCLLHYTVRTLLPKFLPPTRLPGPTLQGRRATSVQYIRWARLAGTCQLMLINHPLLCSFLIPVHIPLFDACDLFGTCPVHNRFPVSRCGCSFARPAFFCCLSRLMGVVASAA